MSFFDAIKPEVETQPPSVLGGGITDWRYSGMGLPWRDDVESYFSSKDDKAIIKSSIFWILSTRIGERVMLPGFGSMLPWVVLEPLDSKTEALVQYYTADALEKWETRIDVKSVRLSTTEHKITIHIAYVILTDPRKEIQNADVGFSL